MPATAPEFLQLQCCHEVCFSANDPFVVSSESDNVVKSKQRKKPYINVCPWKTRTRRLQQKDQTWFLDDTLVFDLICMNF